MQAKLQKTGYTVTDANGTPVSIDGHSYFTKAIARQLARQHDGMYYETGNRTSVKEVVVAL